MTAVCVAHQPAYSSEAVEEFASSGCSNMLQSALSVLGTRAKSVVRMMASDCAADCPENVVVGFADGHLEGMLMVPVQPGMAETTNGDPVATVEAGVMTLLSTDWRWAAYPPRPLAASAWPWKDAAAFESPKTTRTALPRAPAALADRSPLPYCGLSWIGPGPETNPEARACFGRAVRTGHPAEYITHAAGTEGQDLWEVYRFTGSGPVATWYLAVGMYEDGKWSSSAGPFVVYER